MKPSFSTQSGKTSRSRRWREKPLEGLVFLSGIASIIFVALILFFLLREGLPLFSKYPVADFLFNVFWYPLDGIYGILALIVSSLLITFVAVLIAVPIGVAAAVFMAEVAPGWLKNTLKPFVELLAGVPSVVFGFLGYIVLADIVRRYLGAPTGLTAFTGAILLAYMALPTIISIADDAIRAVPGDYRAASTALGATKWQTIRRTTVPAAMSGIVAAIMLGIGRVIGETMTVLMVTGNAAQIPNSILEPVRTLTATIAAEMGEVAAGSPHYQALFAIGIVLFVFSFVINSIADIVLHRMRRRLG